MTAGGHPTGGSDHEGMAKMILSDQAVVIFDSEGNEHNWHDPYSDPSDVEAARIGGYVVWANREPEEVVIDFRGAVSYRQDGHEYLRPMAGGERVCLTHSESVPDDTTCSGTGQPEPVDEAAYRRDDAMFGPQDSDLDDAPAVTVPSWIPEDAAHRELAARLDAKTGGKPVQWVACKPGIWAGADLIPFAIRGRRDDAKQACEEQPGVPPLAWTDYPNGQSQAGSAREGWWRVYPVTDIV